MKRGLGRERRRIQRKWVKKNWMWFVLGCAVALILLIVVLCIVSFIHNHQTYLVLKKCLSEMEISEDMTELVVPGNRCNDEDITVLDFSQFTGLKKMEIGDGCIENVKELKLIGLGELESVVIGMNSFTKFKNTWQITSDPNCHFYLKNCPKLKSLKMGCFSFSDYSVCEIENVDALEVIEMGELNEGSFNFYSASLELKSILIHNE